MRIVMSLISTAADIAAVSTVFAVVRRGTGLGYAFMPII
jgi:hypothetical protein